MKTSTLDRSTLLTLTALGLFVAACSVDAPEVDVDEVATDSEVGADDANDDAAAMPDASTGGNGDDANDPDTDDRDADGLDTDARDTDDRDTDAEDTGAGDTDAQDTDAQDTDGELEAPEDGDNPVEPAVIAQFRATAGPPVAVYEPIEDQQDPIDTRGLLYANAVSRPGDAEDWLQFSIVPGEVDPTIRFGLDCDISDEDPQPLRATLYDEDFNVVELIVCGEEPANVTLTGASSNAIYLVNIELLDGTETFSGYELELDAFCFQGCDYQRYEP